MRTHGTTDPVGPVRHPHRYSRAHRALDAAGWLTAAAIFLFSTACKQPGQTPGTECSADADCQQGFCDRGECLAASFLSSPLELVVTTDPSPLTANQPFGFTIGFSVHPDDLQPFHITMTAPQDALDVQTIAASNQVVGSCTIGPFTCSVLTNAPNGVYADVNGDLTLDSGDITGTVTEGGGNVEIDVRVPDGGDLNPEVDTFSVGTTGTDSSSSTLRNIASRY